MVSYIKPLLLVSQYQHKPTGLYKPSEQGCPRLGDEMNSGGTGTPRTKGDLPAQSFRPVHRLPNVRRQPNHFESVVLRRDVHLIAMTVTLMHDPAAIDPLGQTALVKHTGCSPKRMVPPRSPLCDLRSTRPLKSVHSVIKAITGCGVLVYLSGVGSIQIGTMPCKIDHRGMQAVTESLIELPIPLERSPQQESCRSRDHRNHPA